jgi:hypothetical protein
MTFNWTHLLAASLGVMVTAFYFWYCHRLDKQG